MWSLLDKSLGIVHDARLSGRSDKAIIVERLLSVTGEDAVDVQRKYLEPIRSVHLQARFTLLSNEVPRLSDASAALASRMIFLQLTKSWYGNENIRLTDELLAEREGILLWSIAGWRRLRDRGHFLQPESGRVLSETMEELASPVGSFVKDCCDVIPGEQTPRADLFAAFKEWSKDVGRDHLPDSSGFGRDLRAVVPSLRNTQPRIDGRKTRCYVGIKLKPDW